MDESKTKTPEKAKGKTDVLLLRRIVSAFVLLFLIVYLITVALSASAFLKKILFCALKETRRKQTALWAYTLTISTE